MIRYLFAVCVPLVFAFLSVRQWPKLTRRGKVSEFLTLAGVVAFSASIVRGSYTDSLHMFGLTCLVFGNLLIACGGRRDCR